ncbi:MAG: Ig-like domain-containing protein [Lachnospiraceae bacterium]|nr:Ig-like domain-containing protein [Lachnospiraceae bacterium]
MKQINSRIMSIILSATLLMGSMPSAVYAQEVYSEPLQYCEELDDTRQELETFEAEDGMDLAASEENDPKELELLEEEGAEAADGSGSVQDAFEEDFLIEDASAAEPDEDWMAEELVELEDTGDAEEYPGEDETQEELAGSEMLIEPEDQTEGMEEEVAELGAQTVDVSGTVYASEIPDGVHLRVVGDTRLYIDRDIEIISIRGSKEYDVVVEGDHKLEVWPSRGGNGRAVDVGDFRIGVKAEFQAADGVDSVIRTWRWFEVLEGGNVTVYSGGCPGVCAEGPWGYVVVDKGATLSGACVISKQCDIYMDGRSFNNGKIGDDHEQALNAYNGSVYISGTGRVDGVRAAKDVYITGAGKLEMVDPIIAGNDISVQDKRVIGYDSNNLLVSEGGSIVIENAEIETNKAASYLDVDVKEMISAYRNIDIINSTVDIRAYRGDGMYLKYGTLTIDEDSSVTVRGYDSAIETKMGNLLVKGKLDAYATNDAAIWARESSVNIMSTATVSAESAGDEGIYAAKQLLIYGALSAKGKTRSVYGGTLLYVYPDISIQEPSNARVEGQTIVNPDGTRALSVKMDWQRCQISFEANGGSGWMKTVEGIIKDSWYSFPDKCDFTPPDRLSFSGYWHVKELDQDYYMNQSVNVTRDLTVEPIWEDRRKEINTVLVNGLVEPTPGGYVQDASQVELPEKAAYTVTNVEWYDAQNRKLDKISGRFFSQEKYYAKIYLKAKDTYKFAADLAIGNRPTGLKLNGGQTLLNLNRCGVGNDDEECVLVTVLMKASEVITSVEVNGFITPMAGEKAITKEDLHVPAGAPYEIESADVSHPYYNVDANGRYYEGARFHVIITLKPKSGYAFKATMGGEGYDTFALNNLDGTQQELNLTASGSEDGTSLTLDTTVFYAYPLPRIYDIELTGFEVPQPGQRGVTKEDIQTPENVNYQVTSLTWYEKDSDVPLPAESTFERGKEYYAKIEIAALGENKFYYSATDYTREFSIFTLNGNAVLISLESGTVWMKQCNMITKPMKAGDIIRDVKVKGLDRPQPGEHHPGMENLVAVPGNVQITSMSWYEVGACFPLDEYDVFEQDREYVARIELSPKGAYVFPTDLADFRSLSMEGSENYVIDEAESCVISQNQLLLVTMPVSMKRSIRNAEVSGFVSPMAGSLPTTDFKVPEGAAYEVNKVTWFEGDDVFAPSGTFVKDNLYSVELELSPKGEYAFPGNVDALETICVKSGNENVELFECRVSNGVLTVRTVPFAAGHLHRYPGGWQADQSGHWKICSEGGETGQLAAHTPGDWIIDRQATVQATGQRHKQCKVCGFRTAEEVIPKEKALTVAASGATQTQVDHFVNSLQNDNDPSGTIFGFLFARQKKVTNTSITITWKKASRAAYYVVYGAKCGRTQKYQKIAKVTGASYTQKKLKKGTYYKYLVSAFDRQGKLLGMSNALHISTKGGKTGNLKKVTTAARKNKVTLASKGKTYKLKGKAVKESSKLKVKSHRGVRYESSNSAVATVDSKGKITARGKGTCYITVYAQNGVYVRVKVTVKK